jgi:heme exporter protein CcmD
MDISSPHLPYIIAAYALGVFVFTVLTYWVLKDDRKVRQRLAKLKTDVT